MSDARETIALELVLHGVSGLTIAEAQAIKSALSAMPLASRLALARALVPGWAVVPREATEGMIAALRGTTLCSDGTHVHIYRAMITAAEEPPHGP